MEVGILCVGWPWTMCNKKWVSLLDWCIGTEGNQMLTQKFPENVIYDLTTIKLWTMTEYICWDTVEQDKTMGTTVNKMGIINVQRTT